MLGDVLTTDTEGVQSGSKFGSHEYLSKKQKFMEEGFLNKILGENGETLLHSAAKCSKSPAAVSFLMEIGADPSIRDKRNRLPYNIASCKEIRNEFRRFMGKNPT